jgi:glycosyltransferase involved in cell wall biosynthesis
LCVPLIVQEHSAPFSMHTDTAVKRKAVALALGSARCVCAVGQMLAQEVNTEFKALAPVVVFPNLVRTTLFKAEPMPVDRTALRLVTVGSLERRKGLDILLQAVRLVQDSGQAVQLRIVGTGSLRASLEPQLIRCGQDPATALVGQLTRQQVAHEFENAHVYVCSSRAESFGIAAAEALSVGRPVVTTRCGGPESFVGETCGEVVAPDDPQEMASAILRTWNRLDDFEPICLHAMVDARFGSDAFCDRMLALYDQTVGARAAA